MSGRRGSFISGGVGVRKVALGVFPQRGSLAKLFSFLKVGNKTSRSCPVPSARLLIYAPVCLGNRSLGGGEWDVVISGLGDAGGSSWPHTHGLAFGGAKVGVTSCLRPPSPAPERIKRKARIPGITGRKSASSRVLL